MYGKVVELRNAADEVSREVTLRLARGIALLSTQRLDFAELMRLVTHPSSLLLSAMPSLLSIDWRPLLQ